MHPFASLKVPKGSVGIHWFEQNSYALKDARGTVLMIDPYFPHDRPADTFVHAAPPLAESQLRADAVLLTHAHADHTCIETIGRIHESWPKATYVGPVESIELIRSRLNVDAERLLVVTPGQAVTLGSTRAFAVWAKPPEGDPAAGIGKPDVTHLGYVVEAGGVRLYFSGDEIINFAERPDLVNPVKALHPRIGFLTTHPTEGEFPLFEGSVRMARQIGLATAVPSHYSCFVKRDFDPGQWAALFPPGPPRPLVIPHNSSITYPSRF